MSVEALLHPPAPRDYSKPSLFQSKPALPWLLLILPTVAFVASFFAYPLVLVAGKSIFLPEFSLGNYRTLLLDGLSLQLMWTTVRISLQVSIITLLLSYPLALWMTRRSGAVLFIAVALVLIPLWTSSLVRNYAWILILHRNGVLAILLTSAGVKVPPLLYNEFAVVLGMVSTLAPYMVFTLYNAMRKINGQYMQAAANLGASPFRAFVSVFLPLSRPGVIAGFLLTYILAIGFYITPALLGGGRVNMIAPQIDSQMNSLANWGMGAALAVVLSSAVIVTIFAFVRFFDAEVYGMSSKKASGGAIAEADNVNTLADGSRQRFRVIPPVKVNLTLSRILSATGAMSVTLVAVIMLTLLTLPTIVTIGSSFTTTTYLQFPPVGFSFQWYEDFLSDRSWRAATIRSLTVSCWASVFALILGSLAALAMNRGDFPFRRVLYLGLLGPMIMPTIVLAVGAYFLFANLGLLGGLPGLTVIYTILGIPVVILIVDGALKNANPALERAAAVMGAPPVSAFFRATVPQILPSLAAALLFAFIHAFDDVVIAQFIASTGNITLPKKMWVSLLYSIDPVLSAISTLLILFSTAMLIVVALLMRRVNG